MRFVGLSVVCLVPFGVTLAQNSDPGRTAYETRCAQCHGGDAKGGEFGPSLASALSSRNDRDLAQFLHEGRPSAGMPAFALAEPEMTNLVRYLRSTMAPPRRGEVRPAERRKVELTSGQGLEGLVLNESTFGLQLRGDDGRIHLLRKSGSQYREVTSQADWTSYNGEVGGNRYSPLTQISKDNAGRLAPQWVFPIPNVSRIESTPVVAGGIMYVTSANECFALDAGSGRMIWHFQRERTKGLTGNAAVGFNRGVALAGDRVFMLTDNAHM
ncbi:MAG: c-type cytochrome, partial [Bryobacteraceae bacterium]